MAAAIACVSQGVKDVVARAGCVCGYAPRAARAPRGERSVVGVVVVVTTLPLAGRAPWSGDEAAPRPRGARACVQGELRSRGLNDRAHARRGGSPQEKPAAERVRVRRCSPKRSRGEPRTVDPPAANS